MNILMVNRSGDLGGGNTISSSLARGLAKNKFKLFCFFPEKGPALEMFDSYDIKIIMPKKSSLFSSERAKKETSVSFFRASAGNKVPLFFLVFSLFTFLRKNKIDIVHAHGTRAAFWTKLALLFLRRRPKFIYTLHGLHIVHRPLWQRYPLLLLEKALNFLVDILVCPSISVQSAAEKYNIIKKSKIILIYNGIDIDKFIHAKPLDKKALGIDENEAIISAIQTLDFPKDVSTILRAFKTVKGRYTKVRLLIVGSGPLKQKLQHKAEVLNIKHSVLFLGNRLDVARIIAGSDIVVLSSVYEAMGLCLVEAMAAQKPVIGTNVEGINEIVIHNKNGFLVELGNSKEMAQSILSLLYSQELRAKMGKAGFKLVQEKFSHTAMIAAYQDVYANIVLS